MRDHELSYAVRLGVVLKYLGQLCLVAAALTFVPLALSLVSQDYAIAIGYIVVAAVLVASGLYGSRLPSARQVQHNEALAVAAGMFVITSLLMSVPMMGSGLNFVDAWFESTSAITTTGLSTVGSITDMPRSFLFGRAWMQWYGGLGFVVLSLGLAIHSGVAARQLALTQVDDDDIIGSTHAYAQRMLLIYGCMTVAGVVALMLAGADWFTAVVHCLAAVSTGGFSTAQESLGAFSIPIQATVTVLVVVAAVPLHLYGLSGRRQVWTLLTDLQLRTLLVCGLITTIALFGTLLANGTLPWGQALRNALFNAFSAQTTAGFSTMNISNMDAGSKLILICSMAIGGGSGSTAGGFKLLRLLVLLSVLRRIFARTTLPKDAVQVAMLGERKLEADEREGALCIVALFVMTVVGSWLPFVVAGFDPLDSLFEVVSATGTVGLSCGISSTELPSFLKSILCIDMLMGRLEFIALLILVYPSTWFGRRMVTP